MLYVGFIVGLGLCSSFAQGLQLLKPSYINHFAEDDLAYSKKMF